MALSLRLALLTLTSCFLLIRTLMIVSSLPRKFRMICGMTILGEEIIQSTTYHIVKVFYNFISWYLFFMYRSLIYYFIFTSYFAILINSFFSPNSCIVDFSGYYSQSFNPNKEAMILLYFRFLSVLFFSYCTG